MYYSTLGNIKNPILDKYRSNFLEKLRKLWIEYITSEEPKDNFLLSPDIHYFLLTLVRSWKIEQEEIRLLILREYEKYCAQWGNFLIDQGQALEGTNILITLDFQNPNIHNQLHPDHIKNNITPSFWMKTQDEWHILFNKSFSILEKVSPGFMSEINNVIHKIIPFDVSSWVHNSGSFSDAIGHLLMSYPEDMDLPELALLEAILHEYNHNKLYIIMQTETLIQNDYKQIYYSPYRPDARHIHWIYLGLHALVWAYWVILNAHIQGIIILPENWIEKTILYVLKNGLSLQVLDKYANLCPLGKEILEEMRSVHQECLWFIKESWFSSSTIHRARTWLIEHFHKVQWDFPKVLS